MALLAAHSLLPYVKHTMTDLNIDYIFKIDNAIKGQFSLQIDSQTLEKVNRHKDVMPEWTQLEFNQCPHCPLNPESSPYCPVAVCLIDIIDKFNDVVSYKEVELEVITNTRTISQHTTAQRSLSSLLGLMFATSGCPHTNFFKPMARFHLPLASPEETVFRAAGMYLLSQHYMAQQGKPAQWTLDGLKEIYKNLQTLNLSIVKRIDAAVINDATKNAIVILDMLANFVPIVIDDHMETIRHLFESYLQD